MRNMELNPNHPVTQEVRDHWHKIVAVLMTKFGVTDVEILEEDVAKLAGNNRAVVVDCRNGKFFIRMMSMEQGRELLQKQERKQNG